MAEKDVSKAAEPPKPVHIGGESFLDRILPHMKQIIVAIAVIAVVLMVILFIRWMQERKEKSETHKLDDILEVAREPIRPQGGKPDPKSKSFADAKERGGAVLAEIAKQDTDVAGHAFRGGQLLDTGKFDDA